DVEIQTMKNYINLQQLRFPGHFDYRINVGPELDPEVVLVPTMLVQPFVENAIEHGFNGNLYPGMIEITWTLNGSELLIEIDDNGVGLVYREKAHRRHHESFAIPAVQKRLRMIHKRNKFLFEVRDKARIDPKAMGTNVLFSLPYVTQNDDESC
nr:hypothetical protein [Prolixibacteraceae bacterium]